MKKIFNLLPLVLVMLAFASCDKVDDLKVYGPGTAATLTASSATIASLPADSNKVALKLTWTNPNHETAKSNIKYRVEIDSVGKNFANALVKEVIGLDSITFTAKELNSFLLGRGYAFNVPVSMEAKLITSYANNNEAITSNIIPIKVTPYKVPPKVALPTTGKLFIVGGATQGGWVNPVPAPSQELARINETTWGGIFQMKAGEQYLLLPLNGSWDNKFAVNDNTIAGLSAGGDFGFNAKDNLPGPSSDGLYKLIVDFQTGKFKLTPYSSTLPTNLFIVGDATAGGWNNPVPVPTQQFTRLNASQWQLTLNLEQGKEYLLLPVNGDWSNKYAVANKLIANLSSGGEFGYNLGDNFPAPAVSGNYRILVDFATVENYPTGKFTVTKL